MEQSIDRSPQLPHLPSSRRSFIAGAMAMGLSAAAATRLADVAAQEASPASGAEVDFNALGDDQVTGTFPLTDEKVTLRVLIPSNADVGSFEYEDNEFTRWYEDKTNVHVEWSIVAADEAQTGLNVRLVGGDYGDVIMSFNPTPAVQQLYGGLGTFIPLNDLIDEHAVEFARVVEQYPLSLDVITATDGNIYSLPYVNDCFHCAQDRKFFIYQPWLDALGLEMPTTTEDLYNVLVAFRDGDPNGDGESVYPLATCINSWNNELDLTLMNSFVFNPGEPYLFNQDGTVTAAYATDGWKEGTKYMARLFAEGLIDPESFTQTADQLIAKTSGDGPNRVGAAVGGSWGVFVDWQPNDPSARWADFVLAPPFEGPEGVRISPYNPYLPYATGNFIITDQCEDPALAFRWADGLYDLETTMRNVQGSLDTSWRWATEGEEGIDGEQAIWAGIPGDPNQTGPKSEGWIQTGPSFRSSRVRFGEKLADPDLRSTNLDVITQEVLEAYRQPADMWLPPMFFNEDQVMVVAEATTTIVPFVQEQLARWITGQGDVDAEWDSYLDQLEAMGLSQYLEIHQTTFDRQQEAGS